MFRNSSSIYPLFTKADMTPNLILRIVRTSISANFGPQGDTVSSPHYKIVTETRHLFSAIDVLSQIFSSRPSFLMYSNRLSLEFINGSPAQNNTMGMTYPTVADILPRLYYRLLISRVLCPQIYEKQNKFID